jgi:hypothetical protein
MRVKFLPTLVEAVDGQEKCFRVGNVNRDRHVERSGCLPHFIESRVVDRDQLAGSLFAQKQAQSLQNLDALCAASVRAFDQFRLQARIAGVRGLIPRWLCKHDEPAGMSILEFVNRIAKTLSVTPGQVDHGLYVSPLHDRKAGLGADFKADCPGGSMRITFGDVGMKIDEGEAGTGNRVAGQMKHALRLVRLQRQPRGFLCPVVIPGARRSRRPDCRCHLASAESECSDAQRHEFSAIHRIPPESCFAGLYRAFAAGS